MQMLQSCISSINNPFRLRSNNQYVFHTSNLSVKYICMHSTGRINFKELAIGRWISPHLQYVSPPQKFWPRQPWILTRSLSPNMLLGRGGGLLAISCMSLIYFPVYPSGKKIKKVVNTLWGMSQKKIAPPRARRINVRTTSNNAKKIEQKQKRKG